MENETIKSPSSSPTTWVVRPDPDLQDLIPSFLQNRRNELKELETAISKNDFEFIRRTAHTWKGICRPYGFVHLETLSRELETAGQAESMDQVSGVVEQMGSYLDNVRVVYDA